MTQAVERRVVNTVLRGVRHAMRMSQNELARAVQRAGVELGEPNACTKRLVQKWESGEHAWLRPGYRRALERATGVPCERLGFPAAPVVGPVGGSGVGVGSSLTVARLPTIGAGFAGPVFNGAPVLRWVEHVREGLAGLDRDLAALVEGLDEGSRSVSVLAAAAPRVRTPPRARAAKPPPQPGPWEPVEMVAQQVGAVLGRARVERGLGLREAARALAVTYNTLSTWERGLRAPGVVNLVAFARLAGLRLVMADSPEKPGAAALPRPVPSGLVASGDAVEREIRELMLRLRDHRERLGLGSAWVSKKLGVTGDAVALWESGTRLPHLSTLAAWAQVLGLRVWVIAR